MGGSGRKGIIHAGILEKLDQPRGESEHEAERQVLTNGSDAEGSQR